MTAGNCLEFMIKVVGTSVKKGNMGRCVALVYLYAANSITRHIPSGFFLFFKFKSTRLSITKTTGNMISTYNYLVL